MIDPTADPQSSIDKARQQIIDDAQGFVQNQQDLQQSIAMMMTLISQAGKDPMKAFEAVNVAQLAVLPGVMQTQGDKVAGEADAQNLASALRGFNTDVQNIFNEGGSINDLDAAKFAAWVNTFWKKDLNNGIPMLPNGYLPIDNGSFATLVSSFQSLFSLFGVQNGKLTGPAVKAKMQTWFPKTPTGNAPDPAISGVQDNLRAFANTVSAISTKEQTLIQYDSNQYNQFQGILKDIMNGTASLSSMLIRNEK